MSMTTQKLQSPLLPFAKQGSYAIGTDVRYLMLAHTGECKWAKRDGTHFAAFIDHFPPESIDWNGVLVFNDERMEDPAKVRLFGALMHHMPVVIGPRASHDEFIWAIKPQAEAMGGIMEIAAAEDDFRRRLDVAQRALVIRESDRLHPGNYNRHLAYPPGSAYCSTGQFWNASEAETPVSTSSDSFPGVTKATLFLRGNSGRLNAEKIRGLYKYTRKQIAVFIGVTGEAVRQNPEAESFQEKLKPFERIARLLTFNPKEDNFRRWLHSPNSELENNSPLDVIASRGPEVVDRLVEDILINRGR